MYTSPNPAEGPSGRHMSGTEMSQVLQHLQESEEMDGEDEAEDTEAGDSEEDPEEDSWEDGWEDN